LPPACLYCRSWRRTADGICENTQGATAYGLLSAHRPGGYHGLSHGYVRGGNLPGGGHRPPDLKGLRRRVRGIRHPQQHLHQSGGRHGKAADDHAAHRLSRKRPGEAGKAERRKPPHLRGKANRGRGHGLAEGNSGILPDLSHGRDLSGQYSSGAGLLHRVRRNAAGLPVGGAHGADHRPCHSLHGKAGGQLVFQHNPSRVPDGAAGLRGGGAGLAQQS